jgi:hypothetical protein
MKWYLEESSRNKTFMGPLDPANVALPYINSSEAGNAESASRPDLSNASDLEGTVTWIEKDSSSEPEKYLEESQAGSVGE